MHSDEERALLAGYDNGDIKMFDLRTNKCVYFPVAAASEHRGRGRCMRQGSHPKHGGRHDYSCQHLDTCRRGWSYHPVTGTRQQLLLLLSAR